MKDISEGIRLFNETDFFSAHDFFEDCWISCDREERLFFQGMVQVSVGCFHLYSGNLKGCLSQFNKGITKLDGFKPSHRKIDLEKLISEVESLIKICSDKSFIPDPMKLMDLVPKIEVN